VEINLRGERVQGAKDVALLIPSRDNDHRSATFASKTRDQG
jgi:hypothetical protein